MWSLTVSISWFCLSTILCNGRHVCLSVMSCIVLKMAEHTIWFLYDSYSIPNERRRGFPDQDIKCRWCVKKCIIICKNISKHYDDAWHSFLVLLMISWACCKSHFTGNTVLYCVEIIYLFRHGILCSSYRCGWRWQAGYCIQCCKIA